MVEDMLAKVVRVKETGITFCKKYSLRTGRQCMKPQDSHHITSILVDLLRFRLGTFSWDYSSYPVFVQDVHSQLHTQLIIPPGNGWRQHTSVKSSAMIVRVQNSMQLMIVFGSTILPLNEVSPKSYLAYGGPYTIVDKTGSQSTTEYD